VCGEHVIMAKLRPPVLAVEVAGGIQLELWEVAVAVVAAAAALQYAG
jgi:hypothetical protein